jgi:SAM-dependent methyltransferase
MDHDVYIATERLQESHWWFLGRRAILQKLARSFLPAKKINILDVGCGTGANLVWLGSFGEARGIDPAIEAVEACRRRGFTVLRGSLPHPEIAPGSFDLVTLIDVLEHIENDVGMLEAISRVLKHQGRLLMTVPAWPFLWSGHDKTHHHRRRYQRGELIGKLREAGFRVEYVSYFNFLLSPPIVAARIAERLRERFGAQSRSGLTLVSEPLNTILRWIFSAESRLLPMFRLPFGISLVVVAEKS